MSRSLFHGRTAPAFMAKVSPGDMTVATGCSSSWRSFALRIATSFRNCLWGVPLLRYSRRWDIWEVLRLKVHWLASELLTTGAAHLHETQRLACELDKVVVFNICKSYRVVCHQFYDRSRCCLFFWCMEESLNYTYSSCLLCARRYRL